MSKPFIDSNIVLYLLSGAPLLWSEDMHSGLQVDGLTVKNPFGPVAPAVKEG